MAEPRVLGLNWQPSSVHGWGLIALNLAYHMVKSGRGLPSFVAPIDDKLIALDDDWRRLLSPALETSRELAGAGEGAGITVDIPLLKAVGQDFAHLPDRSTEGTHALVVLELTAMTAEARGRAAGLDKVVACSTWLAEWLASEGVPVAAMVHHGVDHDLFRPRAAPPTDDGVFRIFSGGKLEYRKGQDLVVAAFKRFHARHADARLCFAWTNLFGGGPGDLAAAGHVSAPPVAYAGQEDAVTRWLVENGVAADAVENLGLFGNAALPGVLQHMDVALFPNRAEGSTNMVAMECMAAGVPVVLSANTGHLDLIEDANCFALGRQSPVSWRPHGGGTEHWLESDVDEIVEVLEAAYQDRADAHARGRQAAATMAPLTWAGQTAAYLDAIGWP